MPRFTRMREEGEKIGRSTPQSPEFQSPSRWMGSLHVNAVFSTSMTRTDTAPHHRSSGLMQRNQSVSYKSRNLSTDLKNVGASRQTDFQENSARTAVLLISRLEVFQLVVIRIARINTTPFVPSTIKIVSMIINLMRRLWVVPDLFFASPKLIFNYFQLFKYEKLFFSPRLLSELQSASGNRTTARASDESKRSQQQFSDEKTERIYSIRGTRARQHF